MNEEDYAIVVGVRRYPMFGKTEDAPNDLKGPDRDATAIYDWLTDPARGGVPKSQATLIRSMDYPDPFPDSSLAEPQAHAITAAFDRLHAISSKNDKAGKGRRIGRRLYVYMSGHGFAQRRAEAAVFTANATRERTHHIYASAWSEWFANAGYVDEVVIWMDCCMTFELSVPMQPAGYRIRQSPGRGGKVFAAYAARFPLLAVENHMPDGEFHGVFTYTLLQGLTGEAAEPDTLEITTDSLRSYLINAMRHNISDTDLMDPAVSQEPDFGLLDPIVFGKVDRVPEHPVTFTFPPGATGRTFAVQTGVPLTTVLSRPITSERETVCLPRGVYFARIDELGWLRDFTIVGGHDVHVGD
jgi:hypothetical protein